MSTVISDKNIIRFYAFAWTAGYLVVYFFLRSYLPEEYFRDSLLIQKLALSSDASEWGGAFNTAAFVARILPGPLLSGLVVAIGCYTIWLIVNSVRTIQGMAIIVPVLVPFIILNLMDFGKESFVVPMTYLVLWLATRTHSVRRAMVQICFVYLLYGIFFRDYYLIILVVFISCLVLYKASPFFRLLYILVGTLALFVLPSQLFMDLQGDRDRINYLANIVLPIVHTAILNPLPPTSASHFIINYFYAMFRLTLPITFRTTPSDIVLFLNVLIYGRLIYVGIKSRWMGPVSYLPILFIAHILVLLIFEPDAGSYMRHASSAVVYLLPAWRLTEKRRAKEEDGKQKGEISQTA